MSDSNNPGKPNTTNSRAHLFLDIYSAPANPSLRESQKHCLEIEKYQLDNEIARETLREKRRWYFAPAFLVTLLGSIVGICFSGLQLAKIYYDVREIEKQNVKISEELKQKQLTINELDSKKRKLEIDNLSLVTKINLDKSFFFKNSIREYVSDEEKRLEVEIQEWEGKKTGDALSSILSNASGSSVYVSAVIDGDQQLESLVKTIKNIEIHTLELSGVFARKSLEYVKDLGKVKYIKLNTRTDDKYSFVEWFEIQKDLIIRSAYSSSGIENSFLDFDFADAQYLVDRLPKTTTVHFGSLALGDENFKSIDMKSQEEILKLLRKRARVRELGNAEFELDLTTTILVGQPLESVLQCRSVKSIILNSSQIEPVKDSSGVRKLRIEPYAMDYKPFFLTEFLGGLKSLEELAIPLDFFDPAIFESCPRLKVLRITDILLYRENQLVYLKPRNSSLKVVIEVYDKDQMNRLKQSAEERDLDFEFEELVGSYKDPKPWSDSKNSQ